MGPGNHKGPYKREAGRSKSERGDVTRDMEVGGVHFGGRGRKPRNAGGLWKLGEARKEILP